MNPRHLTIAIICSLIALALLCLISKWLALIYFVCALGILVVGGILVKRSPVNPEWAELWFNCDCCDRSWTADGRIETFTPRICAPMDTCPRCLAVKRKAMEVVTNFVKLEIAKRN